MTIHIALVLSFDSPFCFIDVFRRYAGHLYERVAPSKQLLKVIIRGGVDGRQRGLVTKGLLVLVVYTSQELINWQLTLFSTA